MSSRHAFVVAIVALGCASARAVEPTPPTRIEAPASADAEGAQPPPARPSSWAERVDKQGLPNLHRVNAGYYRGAQPSADGMRELTRLGVKTVVNLRALHSDRDEIGDLPLGDEHISFKAWHPEHEDVVRFLRIVTDPSRGPVFVHCQHGSDRTGMMTAIYRIVVESWSKDEAIAEMTQGGFGFHELWKNLADFVRDLDAEALRRELRIPSQ